MSSSSLPKGWHSRALSTPHPSPSDFTPTRESLVLAILRNAQVETEGFSLALFDDKDKPVAVDALGRVLFVPKDDFSTIIDLAKKATNDPPQTGNFRNTWMIKALRTSQPIDRLLVYDNSGYKETSVSGLGGGNGRELKSPVEGLTELPESIASFFEVGLEGREEYEIGKGDGDVVNKVKGVLGEVF